MSLKENQIIQEFIIDSKRVKEFFKTLKRNKTSNSIHIEKTLKELNLPKKTIKVISENVKS